MSQPNTDPGEVTRAKATLAWHLVAEQIDLDNIGQAWEHWPDIGKQDWQDAVYLAGQYRTHIALGGKNIDTAYEMLAARATGPT